MVRREILRSLKALILPFTSNFFTNVLCLKVNEDRIAIPIMSDMTMLIVRWRQGNLLKSVRFLFSLLAKTFSWWPFETCPTPQHNRRFLQSHIKRSRLPHKLWNGQQHLHWRQKRTGWLWGMVCVRPHSESVRLPYSCGSHWKYHWARRR